MPKLLRSRICIIIDPISSVNNKITHSFSSSILFQAKSNNDIMFHRQLTTMRRTLHTVMQRAAVARRRPLFHLRETTGQSSRHPPQSIQSSICITTPRTHPFSSTSTTTTTNSGDDNETTSNNPDDDLSYIQQHYRIHRRGQEGHGSREYLLLPPTKSKSSSNSNDDADPREATAAVAALLAHRNILFGARCFVKDRNNNNTVRKLVDVCGPLVQRAVQDAEEYGEQPQGMANLQGLCAWVAAAATTSMEGNTSDGGSSNSNLPGSQVLKELHDTDPAALEAVQAIATGVPRPGHSVVGQGTYRDGQEAWKRLAKEYIELGLADEANLYQQHRGKLVVIEHMADTSPTYLQTAGGAMARFFFV